MEAVKPKTKAKKAVKAKPRDQEPSVQEQKPEIKPEAPKAKEQNVAQEVEKPMEAQEIEPQQPGRSPENSEKSVVPRETFGKDFDELLKDKGIENIYPRLKEEEEEEESEANQEQEEETRQRMAQYAEATKENLGMMEKFLEDIAEREAKEKEKEEEEEEEEEGAENGDEESYFYHLVETFRQALVERANSFPDYVAKAKIEGTDAVSKVWKVEKFQKKETAICLSCGMENNLCLDCIDAKFNKEACDELERGLQAYRAMQNSATIRICRGSLAKYRIQEHIRNFIKCTKTFGKLRPDAPVIAGPGCQQLPDLVHDMAYMRHMLKVLFHFDRKKPAAFRELASLSEADLEIEFRSRSKVDKILFMLMNEFYKAVEGWIIEIGAYVLRLASFDDHMFLLQQLLACPGCSAWGGAKLVQFPALETWGDTVFNHFRDVLLAVVRPERKRKPPQKSKGGKRGGKLEWKYVLDDVKGEGGEDIEDLRGFEALESDLLALYEQIPIGPFCNFLLDHGELYDTFMGNFFEMLKALCEAIKKLKEYNSVAKRIVNTITIFLTVAAKRNDKLAAESAASSSSLVAPPRPELAAKAVEHQKQFNACFVSVVYSILTLGNSSLWQFLSGLPFSALDEQGAWQTLGVLHGVEIKRLPQSHADWNSLCTATGEGAANGGNESAGSTPYESFVQMCKDDFTNGTYLIDALGAIGSSPRATEAIELICLDTLYEAGLIDRRTRANFYKTIVGAMAKILERHPERIAYLLPRIDEALSRNMHTEAAESLFSHLPLDIWAPPLDVVWEMGKWATPPPPQQEQQEQGEDGKEKELEAEKRAKKIGPGRRFFERINWRDSRMSVDANLCAALAILNVWSESKEEYMTKSAFDIAGKEKYTKTTEWCWTQLLRLRYARPGEPRTLRPTAPSAQDTARDREMRKPWALAAAQAAGVADGSIPAKSVEPLPLFVGIALRQPEEVVDSLTGRAAEGNGGRQEVVALLSALVDTGSASGAAGAALLLSQFVALVIQASVGSERYLDALTAEFVALVERIVRSESSSAWWKAGGWINPLSWVPTGGGGGGPGTKDMGALLVMDQIEQERGNPYLVSKCAEFWTAAVTKGSAWINDSAYMGVVETVLLSWFCFVDRAVPLPLVRTLVERTEQSIAAAAAAAGNVSPAENEGAAAAAAAGAASLLPEDPVKRTLIGIVWSDALAKVPFLTFQVLLTEAIRRGEGCWSIKTFTQWFNYAMSVAPTHEGNVLYWDVTVHAYFALLFAENGSNRDTLVRDFAPKMVKRLTELEAAFLGLSSAERPVVRFFRGAARAVQSSVDDVGMTMKSLVAALSQQGAEGSGYDPLVLECVTQSPIAQPGRLFVWLIDVERILGAVPRFSRARVPVHFDADKVDYYDSQLARKAVSDSAVPPRLRSYSEDNRKGVLVVTARDTDARSPEAVRAKVKEALGVISASAESEYNRINALRRLDGEYIRLLGRYYEVTHLPNAVASGTCFSCKKPVTAKIPQVKAAVDEQVSAQMASNRSLAAKYSEIPEADKAPRSCVAYLERLIAELDQASAKEAAAAAEGAGKSGVALALCKEVWTMLVGTYNLPHVVWLLEDVFVELIRGVTTVIVRDSSKDAWALLESALGAEAGHEARLPAPQRTFCPWSNRAAFPAMLERALNEYVAGASSEACQRAGELLRACFRADRWLAAHSAWGARLPLEERRAVLCALLGSLRTSLASGRGKKEPAFVKEHCAYVFRAVCDVLGYGFPELLENAVEELLFALALKGAAPAAVAPAAAAAAGFWAMLAARLPLERLTLGKAQNLLDIVAARLSHLRSTCGTCGALASAILAPPVVAFANALLERAAYPALEALAGKGGGTGSVDVLAAAASLADSYLAVAAQLGAYGGHVGDTDIAKNAARAVFSDGLGRVLGGRLGAIAPRVAAARMWGVLAEQTRVLTAEGLAGGGAAAPVWLQDLALGAFCRAPAWAGWAPSAAQVEYLYQLLWAASERVPMQCSAQLPRLLLAIALRVDWRAQEYFGRDGGAEAYGLVLRLAALALRLAPAATLGSDGTEAALAEFHRRLRGARINAVGHLKAIFESMYAGALQRLRGAPDPEPGERWRLLFQLAGGLRVDVDETTPERKLERLCAFATFYANAQAVSPEPHFGVFVPMVLGEHLGIWKSMGFARSAAAEAVVISLFGVYNAEGTRPAAFHKAVVEYLANGRVEEAPYFANYACRSILSTQLMPGFVEDILAAYFAKYGNWQKAAEAVQAPDIGRHEFLEAALRTGAALTLYAVAAKLKKSDPAEYAAKLGQWALRLAVVPGAEHRYLLFVSEVLRRVTEAPNAPGARDTLERLAERLAELGADKEYAKGIGGKIFGMGEASPYTARFRFAAKALNAFVLSQLVEGAGAVRTSDLEPVGAKGDKAFRDMGYVARDKAYLEDVGADEMKSVLTLLDLMVHNNNHTFVTSGLSLMKKIVETLYPDKKELSIIAM